MPGAGLVLPGAIMIHDGRIGQGSLTFATQDVGVIVNSQEQVATGLVGVSRNLLLHTKCRMRELAGWVLCQKASIIVIARCQRDSWLW